MPNFLGEHPKIFKIKTTQDIRPKKLICEQDLDQKKQEIISQHLLKIR